MKRFSLVLSLIVLAVVFSVTTFAAENTTATLTDASVCPGDEVTVTLSIKNSPGIAGTQFYLNYNSEVMSYVSGQVVDKNFFAAFSPEAGANPVKVVTANLGLNNITGDITVAEIKFKVSDNAKEGAYAVSIASAEVYAAPLNAETNKKDIVEVPMILTSGTVTVDKNATPSVSVSKFVKQREYDASFSDVTSDKWFYKFVKLAYEFKLANGTSKTTFSPDAKFTVAQALTAAANIHTVYTGKTVRAVASGEAWYVPYVEYCVDNKIITDKQFANFDANISRGEMAVVFANILPDIEYAKVREGGPVDVVATDAVYNAVKKLYEAGIVSGDENTGNYRPTDEISRSEACVIFTRIAAADERAK